MTRKRALPLIRAALGLAVLVAPAARGADDPAARAFVQELVAAINRKDPDARRALMHPAALKCDRAPKEAMAEGGFVPRQGPIPDGYRWQIQALPAGAQGLFADKFDYPVRPTHQLQIDYEAAPRRSVAIVLQLARDRGGWREVTGCPKPETAAEAKRAAQARRGQSERTSRLAAEIAPALRAELLRLLADGRKVDAILRYREATNEDLAIAKGVVERLESDARAGTR